MSVLRNLETKLADLVEGTFGRVFRSEVRPVELARKLAREMDEHKTVSVSRTYVPNEYLVWLSPEDRERLEEVEDSLIEELSGYLLEHARRERLALLSRPQIEFRTDERLALGEFGIQTRVVRPADEEQADAGRACRAGRPRQHDDLLDRRPDPRAGRGGAGHAPDARAAHRRGPAARHPAGRRDARPQPRLRHRRCRTRTSRAATPRCGRARPPPGRSPTSARRTACSSTGIASRARTS